MEGSPPHTWRTQLLNKVVHVIVRITSTYVENTNRRPNGRIKDEDHLHIRGEHNKVKSATARKLGSPPHTWRTPKNLTSEKIDVRITSTYVENTVKDP